MKYLIKLFLAVFFFCITGFAARAQQKHFIYIQSEDKQPFAIVLNGKVYSSSDYGYVIVPKLTDGEYKFTVSFPMNKFPDQAFTYSINKKDAGFFLKNSNDGWALENMQTQKLLTNNTAQVAQKSAFGDMLSEVVNDSTLTQKNSIAGQPQSANATNPANTTNIAAGAVVGTVAGAALIGKDTSANTGFITDSIAQLEKISESQEDTGTNMLFVDKTQTGNDTISVFIPSETANNNPASEQTTLQENNTADLQNTAVAVIPVPVPDSIQNNAPATGTESVAENDPAIEKDTATDQLSNPFYSPEKKNVAEGAVAVGATTVAVTGVSSAVNQGCTNMVSDGDLDKLKRKMFVQDNDNGMIQYAVKYLNKKCITTDQVKLLGSLFSSDDGRYNLYDALYKYVYDYGNYPVLEKQILDPYYKKRFAAMLR